MSQLLSRLPYFSRQYYIVVEEMLLKLGEDDSEAVLTAIREKLMPALQVGKLCIEHGKILLFGSPL